MLANSCASTLRYYEKRDDFNFLRSSRIRLGYYDGAVTLEVLRGVCLLDWGGGGGGEGGGWYSTTGLSLYFGLEY